MRVVEVEEEPTAPKGLLVGLAVVMLVVGGAFATVFDLQIKPCLNCGSAQSAPGVVIIPSGAGVPPSGYASGQTTTFGYAPDTITLVMGVNNTVTFTNHDTATHTVTANDGSFDSGDIHAGQSWTHKFSAVGTYAFHCTYHSWMQGTVRVVSGTSGGGGTTITIPSGTASSGSLTYTPSTFTVVVGVNNTVTFVNQDTAKHTVTADGGSFDSGDILAGGSWTHAFTTPGTYSFHCVYHTWMKGTITVIAGS